MPTVPCQRLSPFCGNQDKESNPLLAQYEPLCPIRLDKGVIEKDEQARVAKQHVGFAIKTDVKAKGVEKQSKRRRRNDSGKAT